MGTSFSSEVEQPGHLEYFLHDDDANVGYDYDDDDYIYDDEDDDDHHMKPHHVQ